VIEDEIWVYESFGVLVREEMKIRQETGKGEKREVKRIKSID
jgi:hypothetical protein